MWPGLWRSVAAPWTSSLIVALRSPAEIPVVTPWSSVPSTETVNAVPMWSSLRATMYGNSSCSARSWVIEAQTRPLP